MTTPEQSPPTIQEVYEQNHGVLLDTLAAIKAKLDADYRSAQAKTWADIGDQQRAREVLADLAAFLGV